MSEIGRQYQHAKRRCWERYGFEIKRGQYQQLIGMIRNEQGTLVRGDFRVSVWILRFKGRDIKVMYDIEARAITTFLPLQETPTTRF